MQNSGFTKKHPHMILEAIEGQAYVPRYSTLPTLQPRQNVAEHIGRGIQLMAVVIREISSTAMFETEMAYDLLVRFATHDLGESMTGDIIGPTKNEVPEIEEYENTWMRAFSEHSLYMPAVTTDSIILDVVSMVDYAEGSMYSMAEYKLGNHRFKNCLFNYLTALEPKLNMVEAFYGIALESMRMILMRGWHVYNKYKEL